MKSNHAFVVANEKVTSTKVIHVSWSSKYDLLAVATAPSKLLLFRLITKEKVWIVPGPDNDTEILSICWRPDGKVIAVSYNKPKHGVQFICMETHSKSRKFCLDKCQTASLLNWVNVGTPTDQSITDVGINCKEFLPTIPLWQCEADYKKKVASKEPDSSSFSVLLVCDELCRIFMLANGLFPIIVVDYSDSDILPMSSICSVHLNTELTELAIGVMSPNERGTESLWLKAIDLSTQPGDVLSFKAVTDTAFEILSLESHLEKILDSVTEQCEVVSQDIETHLVSHFVKYAKSPDSIGEDLMQMLVWGKASYNLELLFINDVSRRDIKKLISITESTYVKIQQDLTLNFQNALMNMYHHLTELKGIIVGSNEALPISIEDAETLLCTASALMLKTAELLQVIDSSLKNFNLFFRWLYVKAAKIQKEEIDKIAVVHSKDMIFVADFIDENFLFQTQSDSKSSKQFQLDKVYQYFKNEDLASPNNIEKNEWLNLVQNSNILSNSKIIIKPQTKKSLRQLVNALSEQIGAFIRLPKFTNDQPLRSSHKVELFHSDLDEKPSVRFWFRPKATGSAKNVPSNETHALAIQDIAKSTEMVLCSLNTHPYNSVCTRMNFSSEDKISTVTVCDFQPYKDSTITVLLKETTQWGHKYYLAQLKMSLVIEFMQSSGLLLQHSMSSSLVALSCPSIDVLHMCTDVRELDMRPDFISVSVSGCRKVSCVLASDMRTIFPFLMDSREEEEEEEEEGTSISDED